MKVPRFLDPLGTRAVRRGWGVALALAGLMVLVALPPTSLSPSSPSSVRSTALSPGSAAMRGAAPSAALQPLSAPVALGAPSTLGNWVDPTPVPASTEVNATLSLSPRDLSGLESYANTVGAPPLSPSEVQAAFGPSSSSLAQLQSYLAGEGLAVQAPPDGWVWLVRGSAECFERAFDTTLEEYEPTAAALAGGSVPNEPTLAYTSTPRLPGDLPVSSLSAPSPVGDLRPLVEGVVPPSGSVVSTPSSSSSLNCPNGSLTPAKVEGAYNITPVLQSGDEGQGERIGIVDAFDSAENEYRISHDLGSFSACYGLPYSGQGLGFAWPVAGPSDLNKTNSSGWGLEIALDTQWAHATAPDANITLVLSPNNAYGLYYGVDWLVATRDVDVISLSWGEPETGVFNFGPCDYQCNATTDGTFATLTPVFAAAAAEGMSVFAASGDCGANGGTTSYVPWYPASDPHVVGVGGSVLNLTASGGYRNETSWDGSASFCFNGGGSGGGFSVLSRPGWQSGPGFSRFTNSTRGVPDVGLVAAVPLGIFYQLSPSYVEGTSDAAPQWAGMGVLIAEERGLGGLPGFLTPEIYQVLRSPSYTKDFHPITTGWNGYSAGYGWDPITGVGSPQFSALLSSLLSGPAATSPTPSSILFSAEPQAGVGPLPVSFTAGALPAGETPANYTFYYGDAGPPYQEANASTVSTNTSSTLYPAAAGDNLTYTESGAYTAFATAVDTADNVSLSMPVEINVGNAGPIQVQVITTAGTAGMPTIIQATAAGGSAPYRFSYFFGDGTYESSWADDGPTISHVYASNGTYLLGVVANDSSSPMRGGYAVDCVVVGTSSVPCPAVPKTLVTDLLPTSRELVGGESTMVKAVVTWDGVPVAGAAVSLSSPYGTVTPSTGVTGSNGVFITDFTAGGVNRTIAYGLFANATAPNYAQGMGEVLFLVDDSTGPSLTPWVRFGTPNATLGSSVGVMIGGLVAFRGVPASLAAVTVAFSGWTTSATWTGALDATGLYANTWTLPACGAAAPEGTEVLTVSLSLPGYTTAPTTFDLPVQSFDAPVDPGGLAGCEDSPAAAFAIGPASTYDMGSVSVSAVVTEGSVPDPVGVANLSIDSEPEGVLTYWRPVGDAVYAGMFSSPIIDASFGELLQLNVSDGHGHTLASAAGLLEVLQGSGPMNISLVADFPRGQVPGTQGNLSIRTFSQKERIALDRVFELDAPDIGDPSTADNSEIIAWSNAYGNVTFPYQAPNSTSSVIINVQAIGWGIYNFTQTNFTLVFQPVLPPPGNVSHPTPVPKSAPSVLRSYSVTITMLVALLIGMAVIFVLEVFRRRASPLTDPTLLPPELHSEAKPPARQGPGPAPGPSDALPPPAASPSSSLKPPEGPTP